MKRTIPIILLAALAGVFSCNKDNIHNTADKVGISRVTHYATFNMTGSSYVSVVQGGTYTDPGITASENGTTVPVITSGNVNTNQVGLYTINYSAYNKDSFVAKTSRTVVVIPSHEQPGVDLSGKYSYVGSSSYTATVTKVAEGTYTTDNAWSGATVIPVVFISVDGTTITIPQQPSAFGALNGTGTFNPSTGRLVYTISIPSQGINQSKRNWQKQ